MNGIDLRAHLNSRHKEIIFSYTLHNVNVGYIRFSKYCTCDMEYLIHENGCHYFLGKV